MKRREVIKATTLMLGYTMSASAVAGIMAGCRSEPVQGSELPTAEAAEWKPAFFNQGQMETLGHMVETILPETQIPGAREAGAHRFIDEMMQGYYPLEEQKLFVEGMLTSDTDCVGQFGNNFSACTSEQRLTYLSELDSHLSDSAEEGSKISADQLRFYRMLKELTWAGFFSSELIGEEYLRFDPVPGVYHGCSPIDKENPFAWSLS